MTNNAITASLFFEAWCVQIQATSSEPVLCLLQDSIVATALGQKSYNELVEQLVMILGDATPKHLLTPQLSRRTSGYSTPRRTSSGLAAVGPSDLLSPSEIAPSSRQTPDPQKAAAPPSGTTAASAAKSGSHPAESAATGGTRPTGAITSNEASSAAVFDAAQAGGPTGSLVSAQQPPAADDASTHAAASSSALMPEGHVVESAAHSCSPEHIQHALVSPAANMASRAYPLPAAPLQGGLLSTSQGSGRYDAHIAAALTPHPSLASELSQSSSSASLKGSSGPSSAALKASLGPLSKEGSDSPTAAAPNADGKSCFAPGSGSSPSASRDFTTADVADLRQDEASSHPHAPHTAPQHDGTAASKQQHDSTQHDSTRDDSTQVLSLSGLTLNDSSAAQQGQHPPTNPDVNLTGLKLDEADSEQLQLALAISLGQQEAEQAQTTAQAAAAAPQETAEPASAAALPAPVSQLDQSKDMLVSASAGDSAAASEGARIGRSTTSGDPHTESFPDGNSQASGLQATGQSVSAQEGSSRPPGGQASKQEAVTADGGIAHHGVLEEKQLDLLADSQQEGSRADATPDRQAETAAQEPIETTPAAIVAGKPGLTS